jgi:hypothetical protein
MARPVRLASLLTLSMALIGCGGAASSAHTPAEQLGFGVRMAERGLWSEALFRFEQAQQMGAGNDVEVLNNLAVAHEALGNFEEALGFYRRALSLAPGNRDLKANYDRFVSFYESFRAQAPAEGQAAAPGAAPPEPAADAGSPGPPAGPGGEDAPLIPGANEPAPVPDPDPDGDPPRVETPRRSAS